jgi:hypothetical protein
MVCSLSEKPENVINVFGFLTAKQAQNGLQPSFIRTLTVGYGISPHPALTALVAYTTDRELHPAPKVTIFNCRKDYMPRMLACQFELYKSFPSGGFQHRLPQSQLCFDDAVDRANILAARGIKVPDAFNTGIGIDDVNGITLGDGFGRAFWQACAAGNAIILNFHSHSNTLLKWIKLHLAYTYLGVRCQMTKIAKTRLFVTIFCGGA